MNRLAEIFERNIERYNENVLRICVVCGQPLYKNNTTEFCSDSCEQVFEVEIVTRELEDVVCD